MSIEARTKTTRLSVNVTTDTTEYLRSLAKARGITITEVVRRAVAVLNLLEGEQRAGAEIHLVNKATNETHVLHLV